MRDDIIGGLKNALERGATLEQAVQSFIKAGYNDTEVKQAAQYINPGALATLHTEQTQPLSQPKPQTLKQQPVPQATRPQKLQQAVQQKSLQQQKPKHKSNTGKIIFLTIVLLILIGALAGILIFRETVIEFLTGFL